MMPWKHMIFCENSTSLSLHYNSRKNCPLGTGFFMYEGREHFFSKLCAHGTDGFNAVYTSDPFVLTIGCNNRKPYVIDTHPVTQLLGNGNGLVLVGKENSPEVWMSLCVCGFGNYYTIVEWIHRQLSRYIGDKVSVLEFNLCL